TLLQEEKEKAARERAARIARNKAAREERAAKEREIKAAREKEAEAARERAAKATREQGRGGSTGEGEKGDAVVAQKSETPSGLPGGGLEKGSAVQEGGGVRDSQRDSGKKVQSPTIKAGKYGRIEEQRGRLIHPVPGHGRRRPPGMFFQAQPATPVRAVYRGQVVYADWFRGYGLMVILGHGHRAFSLYGHNQRLLVNQGDWVNEGDKIAESGDTGSLEGVPGLYFEIRHHGKVENPLQWLAAGG
ncbi:MAG: peptidoglycan DD-metalloendopeptidase family protein, partial [Magnetococcales bacterium]|nr:peptidoglycan DD-metalloendopeptidase family protein [Magnetococcales bacterium]